MRGRRRRYVAAMAAVLVSTALAYVVPQIVAVTIDHAIDEKPPEGLTADILDRLGGSEGPAGWLWLAGGLIVAHNMNQRQADVKFVKAITTDPKLETLFLHMQGAGVSVTMKKR